MVSRIPEDAGTCFNLGLDYYQAGHVDDAIARWEAALRYDSQYLPALSSLALAYYEQGQSERAQTFLTSAMALDAQNADLHRLQAELWQQQKNHHKALEVYAELTQQPTACAADFAGLIENLILTDQKTEAHQLLQQALPHFPELAEGFSAHDQSRLSESSATTTAAPKSQPPKPPLTIARTSAKHLGFVMALGSLLLLVSLGWFYQIRSQSQANISRSALSDSSQSESAPIPSAQPSALAHSPTDASLQVLNKGVALVIGNADYTQNPLKNPLHDAEDMAKMLKNIGFNVIYHQNLKDRHAMLQAVKAFGSQIAYQGTALFYYAGHGTQVESENYLLPTQLEISSINDIKDHALKMSRVLEEMQNKSMINIVILDACRDNPFPSQVRSAGLQRGLVKIEPPQGTLIIYATRENQTAQDGSGRNGLFTQELIKWLPQSGISLHTLFARVQENVDTLSNHRQRPAIYHDFLEVDLAKLTLH